MICLGIGVSRIIEIIALIHACVLVHYYYELAILFPHSAIFIIIAKGLFFFLI